MNNRLGYDMTMANILWVADALPPHLVTVQLAAVRTAYQPLDPSWDNAQLANLYCTSSSSQAKSVDSIPNYIADKKAGQSPEEKTAQYCYSSQRGQCKNPTYKWPHIMQPKGDKGCDNNRARKDNTPNVKQTQPQNPKISFNIDLSRNILDQIGPKACQRIIIGQYSNNQKKSYY